MQTAYLHFEISKENKRSQMLGLPGVKGSVKPPGRKDSTRAAELLHGVKLLFGHDALY